MSAAQPAWLIALVRDFGPKVIPLDVTPEGTYEESTTRWGMNPVYEAVPREIRDEAEAGDDMTVRRNYFALLRGERET